MPEASTILDRETPMPGLRLGIVGGGQLGRMMCADAQRLGIHTTVLDPQEHPPAAGLADRCLRGSLSDPHALAALAAECDIITYEIEHINVKALFALEDAGSIIRPSPRVLDRIQDKLVQKQLLADAGLPVPRFAVLSNADPVPEQGADQAWEPVSDKSADPAALAGELAAFGLPCIQKTRRGGYDGRGVRLLEGSAGEAAAGLLPGPSMLEEKVDFTLELAVLLARSPSGEVQVYPTIEMVFDPKLQICNSVCAPARISPELDKRAREISIRAVEVLEGVGIFAVELFLTRTGDILINEIAPRPHNSGHWTIEGAYTSQFEQHVRAVCGLPLGSSRQVLPSVMINLLGAPGASGVPVIRGYREAMAREGVWFHWYGKNEVRPGRKMGHITLLHEDLETAIRLANELERIVTVESES